MVKHTCTMVFPKPLPCITKQHPVNLSFPQEQDNDSDDDELTAYMKNIDIDEIPGHELYFQDCCDYEVKNRDTFVPNGFCPPADSTHKRQGLTTRKVPPGRAGNFAEEVSDESEANNQGLPEPCWDSDDEIPGLLMPDSDSEDDIPARMVRELKEPFWDLVEEFPELLIPELDSDDDLPALMVRGRVFDVSDSEDDDSR